ncbi:MAG: ribosome small subunit-dependent GTPase, partial [Verrucomicrobiota bacterium]
PRHSQITRKTSGRDTAARNPRDEHRDGLSGDCGGCEFNPARLERMLVMAHDSGDRPVVVLNKIDLCEDLDAKRAEAERVAGEALVLAVWR